MPSRHVSYERRDATLDDFGSSDAPMQVCLERARLAAEARRTGRQYDIDVFVRKMERLYTILHEVSRSTRRRGVLKADLSFLTSGLPAS